jgi:hypothetical protein
MEFDTDLLNYMTTEEKSELSALLDAASTTDVKWEPLPGPQTMAYESQANIIGFGGAAGGGKTDLAVGKSITQHRKVAIFRVNGTELLGILDRFVEIIGSRNGYNGKDNVWRMKRHDGVPVQIEFGSFPNLGDEKKYQGRPHDLLVFDEAANMREQQVRFLIGWLRTTVKGQKKTALLAFNPPTTPEGRWIVQYFAPWLDDKHPNPALPGEIRWFGTYEGRDIEVEDGREFVIKDGGPCYDFNRSDYKKEEIVQPLSRTFIPSRITDNPYLLGTGYMATLQAMPEPLRSQMLNGDFKAGMQDDAMQVVPTAWVEIAQARWKAPAVKAPMDSVGADIAGCSPGNSGRDDTVIARRHVMWFDEPIRYKSRECPDGPTVAGFIIAATRDEAPQHIDLFGVGSQPYGHLMKCNQQVMGVNFGDKSYGMDAQTGKMPFFNLRSELWWRMREALDPTANNGIALPPDKKLLRDLTAATWDFSTGKIRVCSRDDIIDKTGESPDTGTAYILALIDTPKQRDVRRHMGDRERARGHDPFAALNQGVW